MVDIKYDNPNLRGDAGTKISTSRPEVNTDGFEGEREIVERQKKRIERGRQYRKQYDMPWDRWRRYYGGDQWFNKVRPAWKARPTLNYTFTDIETILPIMTDRRPTINVVGEEEQDQEAGDLMQEAVRDVFDKNEMDVKEILLLKDSHLYGMGVTKQWFNGKTGRVEISNIDTRFFFWSAGAIELQQAEWVGVVYNRYVSSLEAEYPHLKGKFDSEVYSDELTHKPVETVKNYQFENNQVISDSGAVLAQGMGQDASAQAEKMVTFAELWDRDDEGQVWVTVTAGNALVKRRKSPYHHGRPDFPGGSVYPFARNLCYPINSQLVGMGEVAQLESPQDSINRTEAQIADLMRMCTSPYMRVHKDTRLSLKDLTNRIASYIVWSGNHPPDWMPPPGVPGELFTNSDRQKNHMDNLSGVFDAARGELPAAKTSGVAIQSLQQATAGRVGLKTRMFEAYLKEVATQVIYLIQQFYHNRSIRRRDKSYVILNEIVTTGDAILVNNDVSKAKFKIEIGVGSTLPIDKGVRFDQSMQLREAGCISLKQLLRDAGRSEQQVEQIIEELKEEQLENAANQAQAQVMAQQVAAQAAPPAPPAGAEGQAAPPADGGGPPPDGSGGPPPQPSPSAGGTPGQGLPSEDELSQLEAAIAGGGSR
jgi:hypothetical protein